MTEPPTRAFVRATPASSGLLILRPMPAGPLSLQLINLQNPARCNMAKLQLDPPGQGGGAYPNGLYLAWANLLQVAALRSPLPLDLEDLELSVHYPLQQGDTVRQHHTGFDLPFLQAQHTEKGYLLWMDDLSLPGSYDAGGGVLFKSLNPDLRKVFGQVMDTLNHPTVRGISAFIEGQIRTHHKLPAAAAAT